MTNRNGRRGWLAGAVFLLLAVCVLMVAAAPAWAVQAAGPCHQGAVASHGPSHHSPHAVLSLTAGEPGGDAARHHAAACAVAVCPLMHAALVPAVPPAVCPAAAVPAASPFLPMRRGIGVPPPLPPPRPSV